MEADAAAVATSLEEESAGHVASRSSSGTSNSSTTSSYSTSSTSPTKCVEYSGIDVETVSAVPGSLSYVVHDSF